MVVVRIETLHRRACRKPPDLQRIAKFVGGRDNKFSALDVRDAEFVLERLMSSQKACWNSSSEIVPSVP